MASLTVTAKSSWRLHFFKWRFTLSSSSYLKSNDDLSSLISIIILLAANLYLPRANLLMANLCGFPDNEASFFNLNKKMMNKLKNDKSSVIYKIKMTEIEWILNDAMALPNINNGNPLRHYDDLCRHQIVILLEVVNDAALCYQSLKGITG